MWPSSVVQRDQTPTTAPVWSSEEVPDRPGWCLLTARSDQSGPLLLGGGPLHGQAAASAADGRGVDNGNRRIRTLRALVLVATIAAVVSSAGVAEAATTDIYAGYSTHVGSARSSYGGSWNVYEGYSSRIGRVKRGYGGAWNIFEGYSSRVGRAKRGYGGSWSCYEGYSSRIGRVARSGSRWNVYSGYSSRVGSVRGANSGPVGCAALTLGLL
jgi:hypothetical protein